MFNVEVEPPLSRKEKLRRVVILCANFTRNLAFHRAGMSREVQLSLFHHAHPNCAFWIETHSNFFDICVLEWCKLFVERKGKHSYFSIVSDEKAFRSEMLNAIGKTETEFEHQVRTMKLYRDKFVAHLDSNRNMKLPFFDVANASMSFYHKHIVEQEAIPSEMKGLPDTPGKLKAGYLQALEEATRVYRRVIATDGAS